MGVRFNHTLISCRDKKASASFLAELLGLPEPTTFGPFQVVQLEDDASLDYVEVGDTEFQTQHYAFLIGEGDFDPIFERIQARGLDYWADPFKQQPREINTRDGGRGVYFGDLNGHLMEVLTRPYGSGGFDGT